MKAKNLKIPYSFAERRPLLLDRVFFVPAFYQEYQEYTLPSFQEIFNNLNPVNIEYCAGNGDWILENAAQNRDQNWIAVEMRFDRVQKIWSKMKNQNLSNLLIVCGEAYTLTHHYLEEGQIEAVFINFPDPWPKKRHEKHRLIKPLFLDELNRILKPGKAITFVTDDAVYLEETLATFCAHPNFTPLFAKPYYKTDLADYGTSWFEELWREKGKQIHYTQFACHNVLSN